MATEGHVRKVLMAALVALVGVLAVTTLQPAHAQSEVSMPMRYAEPQEHRMLAVGAGAILAVVFFNVLSEPFGSIPLVGGAVAHASAPVIAGSRFTAVLAAAAGITVGHFLYLILN